MATEHERTPPDAAVQRAAKSTVGVDALAKPVAVASASVAVADVIEPGVLDFRGACAWLNLSAPSVRGAMVAGELHAKVYGRKALFLIEELRRYAASLPSWEPK